MTHQSNSPGLAGSASNGDTAEARPADVPPASLLGKPGGSGEDFDAERAPLLADIDAENVKELAIRAKRPLRHDLIDAIREKRLGLKAQLDAIAVREQARVAAPAAEACVGRRAR